MSVITVSYPTHIFVRSAGFLVLHPHGLSENAVLLDDGVVNLEHVQEDAVVACVCQLPTLLAQAHG